MKAIAWGLLIVLGLFSAMPIILNYLLVWMEIRAKPGEKVPSMIPIVGGLLGSFAVTFYMKLKMWPTRSGWPLYALLPPVLDPGCYLLYFLIMPIVWKIKGEPR